MKDNKLLMLGIFLWVMWGIFWLFKRKLRILKRLGLDLTADQLIQKAKEGDKEIQKLLTDTKIFILVGIIYMVLVIILKKL